MAFDFARFELMYASNKAAAIEYRDIETGVKKKPVKVSNNKRRQPDSSTGDVGTTANPHKDDEETTTDTI